MQWLKQDSIPRHCPSLFFWLPPDAKDRYCDCPGRVEGAADPNMTDGIHAQDASHSSKSFHDVFPLHPTWTTGYCAEPSYD